MGDLITVLLCRKKTLFKKGSLLQWKKEEPSIFHLFTYFKIERGQLTIGTNEQKVVEPYDIFEMRMVFIY